jgi:6-phosphogluconolactonase
MGEDGHTASLFLGSKALTVTEQPVAANEVEARERWRLTLTMPCINAARQAVIYVLGGEKAVMIQRVLGGVKNTPPYPIELVGSALHPALWMLDTAAASLLC